MRRCSSLRAFQWVTVVLVALVCRSSGFVFPAPLSSKAAASHSGSSALLPADVTHDIRTRPRRFDGATTSTSIEGRVSRPPAKAAAVALAASRGGGQGGKETEDEVEEKSAGIEPK